MVWNLVIWIYLLFGFWILEFYCLLPPLFARQLADLFDNDIAGPGLGDTGAGNHGVHRLQPAIAVQVGQ
jgi:hypothetical protein